MKKPIILAPYRYSFLGSILYRQIPCKTAKFTGRWKEDNGSIYVEVKKRHFFGLYWATQWVNGSFFKFKYEPEIFECSSN